MPDETVKPDDPNDSAETLRIMADLERYADMHAPTLSDSADVMDEARHRLAVLQQACNAYPALRARVAALEAENARMRAVLADGIDTITLHAHAVDGVMTVNFTEAQQWAERAVRALSPKEPQ